jgi:FAD/FMN-containing dehydrogenase
MERLEEVEKELKSIVGTDNVFTDPATLKKYSKDQSFVNVCMPDFVVFANNVEEVQKVVKTANKYVVPVIPFSSNMDLNGAAIPAQGGIILNLTKMNSILDLNGKECWVPIEAGVTYSQLQNELEKHGFRIMIPFATSPSKSVVSSIIEQEPTMAAASFEYGNAIHMDMEVILPTGDVLRWGKWKVLLDGKWNQPGGGGIMGEKDMHEALWYGAQGTLGTVTQLVVKIEPVSNMNRVLFLSFDELDDAIEPVRRIERLEIGLESFMLNNFNLAAIIADEWKIPESMPCEKVASAKFNVLRARLPKWTFMIHLSGLSYLPAEKVAYEETDLKEMCEGLNITPTNTVAGVEGLENIILNGILHPWEFLKKARYKGSLHTVAFNTKLGLVPELKEAIYKLASRQGYPVEDISSYILPIERGRSCYCEFDFHCDLTNTDETERVKKLWFEVHEALADKGAVLAKPYGPIADILFRRVDAVYVDTLKKMKMELDPNNVMNPGKLCF